MLEGSTQGKMGVGTTQGKTNYPLRESYATQVCRKTKRGPLARAHIELWLLKLLRLARFKRMLERYAEDLKEIFAGLAMAKAVFLTLALSHFCACAWHFLGQECLDERRAAGAGPE